MKRKPKAEQRADLMNFLKFQAGIKPVRCLFTREELNLIEGWAERDLQRVRNTTAAERVESTNEVQARKNITSKVRALRLDYGY